MTPTILVLLKYCFPPREVTVSSRPDCFLKRLKEVWFHFSVTIHPKLSYFIKRRVIPLIRKKKPEILRNRQEEFSKGSNPSGYLWALDHRLSSSKVNTLAIRVGKQTFCKAHVTLKLKTYNRFFSSTISRSILMSNILT